MTPGPDHMISRGLQFAVNVKPKVSIISQYTRSMIHGDKANIANIC